MAEHLDDLMLHEETRAAIADLCDIAARLLEAFNRLPEPVQHAILAAKHHDR